MVNSPDHDWYVGDHQGMHNILNIAILKSSYSWWEYR